eukprot:snap_masked-scaffold_7-processed-gene-2.50-mRNA-1 protein AED:1.00 eAED:1.00 QI:0/-1/0/0/-1/1/1/0/350
MVEKECALGELGFGSTCGSFGDCVNAVCVCEENWRQSTEFAFFFDARAGASDSDLGELPCDTNFILIKGFYGTITILATFTFLAHIAFIRRWQHVKRLSFLLTAIILYIAGSTVRVMDPINNNFGETGNVTLIFSFGIFSANMASLVFFNKYLYFQKKMIKFSVTTEVMIQKIKLAQCVFCGLDFLSAIFLACLVFAKNTHQAQGLFYTAACLQLARALYAIIACTLLINQMVSDLESARGTDKYTELAKRKIKTLNQVRVFVVSFNALCVFCYGSAIVSRQFLLLWKYFLPLLILSSGLMTLGVLVKYQEDRIAKIIKPSTKKHAPEESFKHTHEEYTDEDQRVINGSV